MVQISSLKCLFLIGIKISLLGLTLGTSHKPSPNLFGFKGLVCKLPNMYYEAFLSLIYKIF